MCMREVSLVKGRSRILLYLGCGWTKGSGGAELFMSTDLCPMCNATTIQVNGGLRQDELDKTSPIKSHQSNFFLQFELHKPSSLLFTFTTKMSNHLSKPSEYVTLVSNDGFEFIITRSAAYVSAVLKRMLDPRSTPASLDYRSPVHLLTPWLSRQLLGSA